MTRRGGLVAMALTAVLAAGCGSSASSSSHASAGGGNTATSQTSQTSQTSSSPTTATTGSASILTGHGTVSVLYAGSLVNLMEHDLGPAFDRATGFTFQGVGAGSTELVQQIKGGIRQGDVFISASPKANKGLEGSSHGNWVSWYAAFAKAPLVLGFDPHSRFASQLRSRPWYDVITEPGIRVGRTDPKLDPKGKLTVTALHDAAERLHRPQLVSALASFPVFPEEDLVGRLESGQLDAGFFYANEATEQHIPTVSLRPASASATYTVTILRHAPDSRGAAAFVLYLLGASGRSTLTRHGLALISPPKLTGSGAAIPAALRTLLGG